MDTKYTPGPWEIIVGLNGSTSIRQVNDHTLIVYRVDSGSGFQRSLQQANTRLITAAPELLEALQEIVTHATKYGAAPLSALLMFDRARAAIAKAKGKEI